MRHTALWSCIHIPNIIDLSQKKQLFDLEVKVPRRSLRYVTHHLMVMQPHTKYHWPISKDKNVMARKRKYYLKNNYLTLRSKVNTVCDTTLWSCTHIPNIIDLSRKKQLFDLEVKVPPRSLWYATHCFMVMHPHTNYHWPTSKDKNVMTRTSKYYLKNNNLTLRSKSHEGHHYGTRHTALWSCTHIRNIIDLSRKTKKLWSGQASLRRSGRKNQTKTICLPSFEGET
jgi:hypothetical protein